MKTQMKFQKILSLVTLIIAALSIVLGMLFCSGIIEKSRIYTTGSFTDKTTGAQIDNPINADALKTFSQSANNVLVIMAIVYLLVVVTLYIMACNSRRNYYITNYISIGLVVVYSVVFAITLFVICGKCAALASQIDMAQWKAYVNETSGSGALTFYVNAQSYSESYVTIILGFILGVLILLDVVAWVLATVWKIKLMKGEKELLSGTFAKEVA